MPLSSTGPQKFPPWEEGGPSANLQQNTPFKPGSKHHTVQDAPYTAKKIGVPGKRKLLHLTHAVVSGNAFKSPETYLPAGTYFKVVTAMGVVVSTGTNSSSDPQPILLRIVDNGNLPGGLKGKVKNAVLIGTCYGSASAEWAICRLRTLSWRDPSGRNIEKPVEGWIASEDGVQGIRAKMVDRSSEVVREAFGAGLLSAASNFLKFEATSSVYPMAPFGQTNALSKSGALKGAIGTGAGSALDKLAEFSIKRAESMSPVAYVASGRILDAVLLRGVDLSPVAPGNLYPPVLSVASGTSEVEGSPDQNSQTEGEKHDPS
jgi:conjugal transfer pilus assembly protein TraB